MSVSRAQIVDGNLLAYLESRVGSSGAAGRLRADLDEPVRPGSGLSARRALSLFEAQLESRVLDFLARDLKAEGEGYYTISGAGHEGNAVLGAAMGPRDQAFLHYRSGAFFCARAQNLPGPAGPFDVLRGMVAAADEPIAGGRHKVYGSVELGIPPQTSTIASHLPKALGYAVALDRRARLEGRREDAIAICTFGDASANHSTAAGAIHAAGWTSFQNVPAPVLFVCEDNGLGISVRTPQGWIAEAYGSRAGVAYFAADGLDLPEAWDVATAAVEHVRMHRSPAFLHLRTVRLLGHAGSDVEQLYRSRAEIEATEASDPLLNSAALLIDEGWMSAEAIKELYADTKKRLGAMAQEAKRRPKLRSAEEVMQPLAPHDAKGVAKEASTVASGELRMAHFGGRLPELEERPRHMALQLNRGLGDLLLARQNALLFGEDVARKGGVYHVSADLSKKIGVGRVFNTLLDESSILGLALGAGQAGMLPIPEIQYLAYLMNAIDQLRGEAGSLSYFSKGQFQNPMVVRIAGLAYQRGFGGHFHNDNGIAALREIPGLILGCPSRGDDAVRMLRTMAAAALVHGQVSVLLEPIALYMTKDLYESGDGLWQTLYPEPSESLPLGEVATYGEGQDLCIASYANGLHMSLRVAARLRAEGHGVRVVDLRWLQPLPVEALLDHSRACDKLLIVDECRASSGVADALFAEVCEREPNTVARRVQAPDTYIPLGDAANLVLIQEADIEVAARALLEGGGGQ
jgi:2-oxoisovalerate dehydrogenase E1 component